MNKGDYKRYCKALQLKDDPELIEAYKQRHSPGSVWPEIIDGLKQVGVMDMEIYLHRTTLFMVMDTVPDFDHQKGMDILSGLPRQQEWEGEMSKYQQSDHRNSAIEKWTLLERVFNLGQKLNLPPEQGQLKNS